MAGDVVVVVAAVEALLLPGRGRDVGGLRLTLAGTDGLLDKRAEAWLRQSSQTGLVRHCKYLGPARQDRSAAERTKAEGVEVEQQLGQTYSTPFLSWILAQSQTPRHFAPSCGPVALAPSADDTGAGADSAGAVVGSGVAATVTTVVSTTVMTRGVGDGVAGPRVRPGGTGTTMTDTTLDAVTV